MVRCEKTERKLDSNTRNRSRGERSIQKNTIKILEHSLDVNIIGSMSFVNADSK